MLTSIRDRREHHICLYMYMSNDFKTRLLFYHHVYGHDHGSIVDCRINGIVSSDIVGKCFLIKKFGCHRKIAYTIYLLEHV